MISISSGSTTSGSVVDRWLEISAAPSEGRRVPGETVPVRDVIVATTLAITVAVDVDHFTQLLQFLKRRLTMLELIGCSHVLGPGVILSPRLDVADGITDVEK